jgi:hypothetical protein
MMSKRKPSKLKAMAAAGTPGALRHDGQALVQRRSAAGDVASGIGLAADAHVPPGFGGQ